MKRSGPLLSLLFSNQQYQENNAGGRGEEEKKMYLNIGSRPASIDHVEVGGGEGHGLMFAIMEEDGMSSISCL